MGPRAISFRAIARKGRLFAVFARFAIGSPAMRDPREIRTRLRLSRAEFARFFGVSEATVTRWESDEAVSEPSGLQAILLRAVMDALGARPPESIARVVRSCGIDHRAALAELLRAASERPPATDPPEQNLRLFP